VPDLSSAHPTNTRDGAAVLSERFAARLETQTREPGPDAPIEGASVAAQLIANWFAPVRAAEETR
jgi:hypothetical protein